MSEMATTVPLIVITIIMLLPAFLAQYVPLGELTAGDVMLAQKIARNQ